LEKRGKCKARCAGAVAQSGARERAKQNAPPHNCTVANAAALRPWWCVDEIRRSGREIVAKRRGQSGRMVQETGNTATRAVGESQTERARGRAQRSGEVVKGCGRRGEDRRQREIFWIDNHGGAALRERVPELAAGARFPLRFASAKLCALFCALPNPPINTTMRALAGAFEFLSRVCCSLAMTSPLRVGNPKSSCTLF
jgi:hypothetical protein